MNPDQIRKLKFGFERKVHTTDQELWDSYDRSTWTNLNSAGGEHEIFLTRSGEIAKEVQAETLADDNEGEIGIKRFNRFKLELRLPKSRFLTTTVSVSPTFSIELSRGFDIETYIIQNPTPPSLKDRLLWCKDIYSGLALLHLNGVAHLDLKPDNIFMNGKQMSIGDFGNLHVLSDHTVKHSTILWGPPLISRKIGIEIDMYSASLLTIGILSWKSSIIFQCADFSRALVSVGESNLCGDLGRWLTDECTEQFRSLNLEGDFISELRCSILGNECVAPSAFKTIDALDSIIERV